MEFNPFKGPLWPTHKSSTPEEEIDALASGEIINDAPPAADRAKSIVEPPADSKDALPPLEAEDPEHEARVAKFLEEHGENGMKEAA
ncbi:MAG: hypothetical protein KGI41_02305 [Patescibacteria group bacterium]|nr:hypothetical protein [Patescibacteria group bacterium]MDE1966046.1 hypothetical protein [Patescibacteria group bacterium]